MNGSIPTTSSSSLASYSAISTLERQHAAPLGQRLMLFVQANAACCLEGGVESILKLHKHGDTNVVLAAEQQQQQMFDDDPQDDFDAFGFLQVEINGTDGNGANGANGGSTAPSTTAAAAPKKKKGFVP